MEDVTLTDDEIIAVVRAHIKGRQIQRCDSPDERIWSNVILPPNWYLTPYRYRVAPEPRKPREWTMGLNIYGDLVTDKSKTFIQLATVRVREVIE